MSPPKVYVCMSASPSSFLRPPPNRDFLQGYPGISASDTRPDAHLSGTVEVQTTSKGVEAAWLRIEMCKIETLPRGETWKELIGQGPIDVWTSSQGGSPWELLRTVRIASPSHADSARLRSVSTSPKSYHHRCGWISTVGSATNSLRHSKCA
ncbi:division septum assembly protein [Malassezia pachydermatis]